MKIHIDIGHPGHVHYFRNFYFEMLSRGHEFIITARERPIIVGLLNYYKIPFIGRGIGSDSRLGKLRYMLFTDVLFIKEFVRSKPDLSISFSSPYAAQVSWLLRFPHIALNDTEHTDKVHKRFTYPFSKSILTPSSYQNDLGGKQVRFNSIVESFYLNSKRFEPDQSIYEDLKIGINEEFAIIRFVSWNAFHDVGQGGLNLTEKKELVHFLASKMRLFISSEGELPTEFSEYQIKISSDRMHDVLSFATIFVGESGTMSSESALLGTPAVYVNSLPLMCYLKLEQEYGLLKHFVSGDGVLSFLKSLSNLTEYKLSCQLGRIAMIKDFIDPTQFLVWFIENYPDSQKIMRENPDYQFEIA